MVVQTAALLGGYACLMASQTLMGRLLHTSTSGVDYLKYDNCWAPAKDWVIDRYVAMREALKKTGRPIVYSLCEWGVADPWAWAPEASNTASCRTLWHPVD
jgi:hypothetical protein